MTIYDNFKRSAPGILAKFYNPNGIIEHQVNTPVSDGMGGTTKSWETISNFRAAIIPNTGSEQFTNGRLINTKSHDVFVLYDDANTVTVNDRFIFNTRVFSIVDIKNIAESNTVLQIEVMENDGD